MRLGGFVFACRAIALPALLAGTDADAAETGFPQAEAPVLTASMVAPPQVVLDYAPRLRLHPNESYWPALGVPIRIATRPRSLTLRAAF